MNRLQFLTGALALLPVISSAQTPGKTEVAFKKVSHPPPIQLLVPGFTVRELPLDLNNINCLTYAPDGRLFALCYDGNVLQLKDTDGDGLEDTAVPFFKNDNNEIPPSIGMAWGPGGLYIASQRRVVRLRDKGDGTGELETVASGWPPPTGAAGSGLDAVGIAVDNDGFIYFGIGCDDWQHAYRVDKNTGQSAYDLHSERGTIQKVSPDWKHRETIATGLRFTVSLDFSPWGDLFCTDQEGATWLPNGNPFDELLNIQTGRHYGFPPSHPRYLTNVIDEPSVFDFGPQHQSTCGLHFNDSTGGVVSKFKPRAFFGPAWWDGNAFIAGESRGKIWRTTLAHTAAGYVAQSELIACLSLLTIDAVPTPAGDLIVTCHTGKPDWGTGPKGKGKLFKISYTNKSAPQPVLAYAASPTETRIVFDRPLDPEQFRNLAARSKMVMGKYVTAGERFESFSPGYQAVKDQATFPRWDLKILSAGITADKQAITLQTVPRTEALNYGVTVPFGDSNVDMLCENTGVEASLISASGQTNWSGWVPHMDTAVSAKLLENSGNYWEPFQKTALRGQTSRHETLVLHSQIDLWRMLHPMIQPGAKLDYEYPQETVTLVFKAKGLKIKTTGKVNNVSSSEIQVTAEGKQNAWLPLEVAIPTGEAENSLRITWFTDADPRPRALPLRRFFLPWATPNGIEQTTSGPRQIPEIAGGDWQRGKKIFFSEPAVCYKCHTVAGEGGKIGPELSNLVYRDYASVLRDITEPSAAINPDHLAYNITFKDGDGVSGVILSNTPTSIVIGQVSGENLVIAREKIAAMKASSISLMPEGLLKGLNAQQQKDLLAFLLARPD